MRRTRYLIVALALCAPSLAAAQEAPDRFEAARLAPAAAATPEALPQSAPLRAAPEPAEESARRPGRSFLSSVLHTLGGAVVGGWVGYVGSQVTLSDWEKENNSSFSGERAAWVAGGMAVGILGSRLIGRTYAPSAPGVEVRRPRSDRNVLTRAQIESSGATNVYELVHTMRKDWLVPRGVNSFRESATGRSVGQGPGAAIAVTPGQAAVVVYLDDLRLGAIERMREILINDIMEIRFIEPQEAAYRYGSGHSHGVILLKTVP